MVIKVIRMLIVPNSHLVLIILASVAVYIFSSPICKPIVNYTTQYDIILQKNTGSIAILFGGYYTDINKIFCNNVDYKWYYVNILPENPTNIDASEPSEFWLFITLLPFLYSKFRIFSKCK